MFDKQIDFYYGDNNSELITLVHPNSLVKTAGYSDILNNYIAEFKGLKNKTYALVNALSAGEFFGSNRNGDYFPEDSLKKYHKTFEALGHVYKHHVNKDPNKSMGKVVFSHYNEDMHRVELIIELDNEKAKEVIEDLNSGKLAKVSMGCRVPWDECSYCGNRAKNRGEYCEHLLTQMNKILPGGKKVFALNIHPKFFDISIVFIPAEPTAGILKKINISNYIDNDEVKLASYDEKSYIKLSEFDNYATIKKEVVGTLELLPEELKLLTKAKLPEKVFLKKSGFMPNEILSTCLALRIMPDIESFRKLASSINTEELATKVINNVSLENFNSKIANILLPEIHKLASTKEYIVARGLIKVAQTVQELTQQSQQNKQVWGNQQPPVERSFLSRIFFGQEEEPRVSPIKNPIVPLGILGTLYYGYSKHFNNPSTSGFRDFMSRNPWLLPVIVGGAVIGAVETQDKIFQKNAGAVDRFFRNSLIALPVSYIAAGSAENDAQQGIPISSFQNFIRKHPALTGILGAILATKGETLVRNAFGKVASFIAELPESQVNTLMQDLAKIK